MKNAENYISINIKPIVKTSDVYTGDEFVHCDYITTVHGDRLEVDDGTWYLWCANYLITSGNTRDLHAIHNYAHNDSCGACNYIELDYTPISRF